MSDGNGYPWSSTTTSEAIVVDDRSSAALSTVVVTGIEVSTVAVGVGSVAPRTMRCRKVEQEVPFVRFRLRLRCSRGVPGLAPPRPGAPRHRPIWRSTSAAANATDPTMYSTPCSHSMTS